MRIITLIAVWTISISTSFAGDSDGSLSGISTTKPEAGPYVSVDGKYMVPYTQQIPGTDISIEMVPVPGGTFTLGSPNSDPNHKDDEGPQISVQVDPVWVAKTEITWQQYLQYMDLHDVFQHFSAVGERTVEGASAVDAVTAPTPLYEPSFTFEYGNEPNQPAVTMTQYAAKQYGKWLSGITGFQYRLPTEAEWEYAARGGAKTAYYWGDTMDKADDHAWHFDNAETAPESVGMKSSNPFGLHDMLGGVAEWTVNQYEPEGYKAYVKNQPASALDVVKWPTVDDSGVARGGSWESDPGEIRCASRLVAKYEDWKFDDPNFPKSPWWCTNDPTRGVGFRLFRSYKPLNDDVIQKFWDATDEDVIRVVDEKVADGRSYYGKADKTLPAAIKAIKGSN